MSVKALLGNIGDVSAGAIALGAFLKMLPPLAAFLSIVYLLIRIGEWARVVVWDKPPRKGKFDD